jgi:hypothetical protein
MPNDDNITAPITLVGSHRSGTSLISGLFERHPEFALAGETANLIFHTWAAAELCLDDIPPLMEESRWVADEELCSRLVRQAFLTCLPGSRPRWFHKPIGIPLALSERFGEDQWPQAADWYWKVLGHSFPQAKYFTILRNPCDVALSTRDRWGYGPYTTWWSIGFMAYLINHPASRVTYAVSYQRLVDSPRETVQDLFAHLGIPAHEECLETVTRIHAPARGRENIDPRATSRRADWGALDPAKANPRFLRAIQGLFDRFNVPLEWPESFLPRLSQSDDATDENPVESERQSNDLREVIMSLNQRIRNLHLEYAQKLRHEQQASHGVYTELTESIRELEKGKAWLESQLKRHQDVIADQQTWIAKLEEAKAWWEEQFKAQQQVIADQKAWIQKLEEAKTWWEEQRQSQQRAIECQKAQLVEWERVNGTANKKRRG